MGLVETEIGILLSNFGVPTSFAILMYYMYNKNQKWWQEQSEAQGKRYYELAETFIVNMNKLMTDNKVCISELSSKINNHTRSKEEFIGILTDRDNTINQLFGMLKEEIKIKNNRSN